DRPAWFDQQRSARGPSRANTTRSRSSREVDPQTRNRELRRIARETPPEELRAQERRIPDDEFGLGPAGFLGLRRVGQVQEGVAVLDVVERLEDRVAPIAEAVADHPLDLADPD